MKFFPDCNHEGRFLFETQYAKGICSKIRKDTENNKLRFFQIFSLQDNKYFSLAVSTTKEKVTEKELNRFIDIIIQSIEFSPDFPKEEEIKERFKKLAQKEEQ